MGYEIWTDQLAATVVASVRRRVEWREIGVILPRLFEEVYAFLRAAPVAQAGQNVCIYHDTDADGADLEVGVQVSESFVSDGEVRCSATPSGRVAATVHVGDYAQLGEAHDALVAWCRELRAADSGPSWEVYGDWSDDPAARRTKVYRRLAVAASA